MNLHEIVGYATNKENFTKIRDYADFCLIYLDFINENPGHP